MQHNTARPQEEIAQELKAFAKKEDVLIGMYSGNPEPPTLNAILQFSKYFKSITFLRNNLTFSSESYPFTPVLKEIGSPVKVEEAATKNTAWKLLRFARYCFALYNELRSGKYKLVVLHDYLGLLAYWLVKQMAGYKGISWFNSYDVLDTRNIPINKFSLINMVVKNHEQIFSNLDFFSLPAVERKQHYPVGKVKKATFVIPNFPAISFYEPFFQSRNIENQPVIKLIYQGALGQGHGYENIIRVLDKKVQGKPLQLVLKGWITPEYKQELMNLAQQHGVADKLVFEGFSLYRSVPLLASTCTIGLAIFTKDDIMNKTLGTASNKIYEYAAVGLPVVLFDTPHFRQYLSSKEWAYFTDLSEHSLLNTIEAIMENYEASALAAHQSFREEFNFEKVFTPSLQTVIQSLHDNTYAKK